MSYRCEACGLLQDSGQKPEKIVTEVRAKTYVDKLGNESHGHETVSEVAICPWCAARLAGLRPKGAP